MTNMSLLHFAAHLSKCAFELEAETRHSLEKAAILVATEAKNVIGHYQPQTGPYAAWQPLAQSTLDGFAGHPGKVAKGQAPPDNPLLATGQLRDSIHHKVGHLEAVIGTNDPDAIFHELGTKNEPPRPFLGVAGFREGPKVAHLLGQSVFAHIMGRKLL